MCPSIADDTRVACRVARDCRWSARCTYGALNGVRTEFLNPTKVPFTRASWISKQEHRFDPKAHPVMVAIVCLVFQPRKEHICRQSLSASMI